MCVPMLLLFIGIKYTFLNVHRIIIPFQNTIQLKTILIFFPFFFWLAMKLFAQGNILTVTFLRSNYVTIVELRNNLSMNLRGAHS